jgi:hypothetical protein
MVTLDSVVKIADDVIFQELEGEAVLLNMQSEIYFGLDAMGTRIWELLKTHGRIQMVSEALLNEYEVGEEELRKHLCEFIDKLHTKGLVEVEEVQSRHE